MSEFADPLYVTVPVEYDDVVTLTVVTVGVGVPSLIRTALAIGKESDCPSMLIVVAAATALETGTRPTTSSAKPIRAAPSRE